MTDPLETVAPPPDPHPVSTPTAEDVRAMVKATNRRTLVYALALLGLVVGVVWYTAGGRAASIDSNNSTKIQLANNARNDCLRERRDALLTASGWANIEANNAEASGLLDGDDAAAEAHREAYDRWVAKYDAAARSLEAKILRQPPPVGCGPVIASLDDIPDER